MTYDGARNLAQRLVTDKGKIVTFTRPGAAVDPITQTGGGATTTYTAPMVATPLSAGKAAQLFGAGAANTFKRRLSVTIALKGVAQTPNEGDRFTWGGQSYRLISVDLLNPDGTTPIVAQGLAEA
jgi:hypothetical protein